MKDLIDAGELNIAASRLMRKNDYNKKDLDDFCEELNIRCIISNYDEGSNRNQFKSIVSGVKKFKAKYIIELSVNNQHFFKLELDQIEELPVLINELSRYLLLNNAH